MNKKELIEMGVPEALVEQVIVAHGKDIEATKAKYAPLEEANKSLSEQLTKATETVDSFKAMDIDGIKKAADDYKAEAEKTRVEAEDRLYQMQFEHALDNTLKYVGARNPRTVMALLDYDKLDLAADGTITGLEDQLVDVATDNPFLFETPENTPRIVSGGANHSVIGDAAVAAARKAAGLDNKKE